MSVAATPPKSPKGPTVRIVGRDAHIEMAAKQGPRYLKMPLSSAVALAQAILAAASGATSHLERV